MQENFSFSTDNKDSGLKKRQDLVAGEVCWVPNCRTVLQKVPRSQGFHLYQAACPKIRKMSYAAVAKWVYDQGIFVFIVLVLSIPVQIVSLKTPNAGEL